MTMLFSFFFLLGVGSLAAGGMLWNWGNYDNPATPLDEGDPMLQVVWAPIAWNFGFAMLLLAVFGMATMMKDMDPLGRLLLWMVALILILLLFTAPGLFFDRP